MTTLPTLTPCPKPDCKTPHRHASYGALYACHFALSGRPCPHDDPACHAPRATAPRVTAPLHLPDVDTVARKIYDTDHDALLAHGWTKTDGKAGSAKVTEWRVGTPPHVDFVEGCA